MTAGRKYSGSTENKRRPCYRTSPSPLIIANTILTACIFLFSQPKPSYPALVDKAVAMIGDKVLSYREVQLDYTITRLLDGMRVELYKDRMEEKEYKAALDYSIRKALVLKYLERIALKRELQDRDIESRVAGIRKSVKDLDRFLKYYEMDIKELEVEIEEKLNVDYFFEKARGVVDSVSDKEIRDYYEKEKDNKFYGKSFDELKGYIKRYLEKQKTAGRNDEWIREQMEKNKVRILE